MKLFTRNLVIGRRGSDVPIGFKIVPDNVIEQKEGDGAKDQSDKKDLSQSAEVEMQVDVWFGQFILLFGVFFLFLYGRLV